MFLFLGDINDRYWTSGNVSSGMWGSTGKPIDPDAPWVIKYERSKADPYSGAEKNCIEMAGIFHFLETDDTYDGPKFGLNDVNCCEERYPICEKYIQDEENIKVDYVGPDIHGQEDSIGEENIEVEYVGPNIHG